MSGSAVFAPAGLARDRARRAWMMHDVAMLLVFVVGLLIVVYRDQLLPSRFFYDGNRIQAIAQGLASSAGDNSYGRVAAVYRWLGLANLPLAASVLSYLLAMLVLLDVRKRMSSSTPTLLVSSYAAVYVLLSAVYLGFYSKDAFVLVIALLVLRMRPGFWGEAAIVAGIVAYGTGFRSYWILIAAVYIGLRVLTRRRASPRMLVIGCLVALVAVAIAIQLVLGVEPDHYRAIVNSGRLDSDDAATIILPIVPGAGMLVAVLNIVVTFVTLVVPIPLARVGGAYYFGLSVVVAWLWISVLASSRRVDIISSRIERGVAQRAMCLLFAFLVTQAFFEPDYGSALRHLTPLLPIALYVIWATRQPKVR